MGEELRELLHFTQGPVFRFAFAMLILGCLRSAWIAASDASAAFLIIPDRREFWRRLRLRTLWPLFPTVVIRRVRGETSRGLDAYHTFLAFLSIVFRFSVLVIPAFMVAHVYLWERALGASWPSIPAWISDIFSIIAVLAGLGLLIGRIYSPLIRSIDPVWAFFKPLILLIPFVTGLLAMHPTWSPANYHVTMLLHTAAAAAIFIMIPFARLLSFLHPPIEDVLPELAWPREAEAIEESAAQRLKPGRRDGQPPHPDPMAGPGLEQAQRGAVGQ